MKRGTKNRKFFDTFVFGKKSNERGIRGQLTIFIIIAVLIIAIIGLFFVFRDGLKKEKIVSPEVAPIKNFVQECLDETSESAVFDIAERGGYEEPSKVSSTIVFNAPYYIKNNKNLMPTKEKIQDEISKYIKRELVLCLGNFALFPEYQITNGEMIPKTIIESERVLIEVNYPLTIIKEEQKTGNFLTNSSSYPEGHKGKSQIKGETKSKIEDFNSEVPVRFGIVYDAVAEFVGRSINYKGVCINCLLDISSKNNLQSDFSNYDNKTNIFIINDPQSKLDDREFVYVFANEY